MSKNMEHMVPSNITSINKRRGDNYKRQQKKKQELPFLQRTTLVKLTDFPNKCLKPPYEGKAQARKK